MLKRILVPMDGSERSKKALDFALDLAATYGAKLWVMHVIDRSAVEETEEALKDVISGVHVRDAIHTYQELAVKDIFEKARKKSKVKGVSLKTYCVSGKPAEQIISYARKVRSDLIVIGSTGFGRAEQFLFGSVTDKVARHASCPVTIVR